MWRMCTIYNILYILIPVTYAHDFRTFDDTIIYKINWPGKSNTELLVSVTTNYFVLLYQTVAVATDSNCKHRV